MATKKKLSPLQRAYNRMRSSKAKLCQGKSTKAIVKQNAAAYVRAAIKAGQTKAEATKKANRVVNGGCSMSSRVSGTKKRKTTRRRK